MEHATLIVLLALLQYVWFTIRVGSQRSKHKVHAPACEGDDTWERMFRIQQNTMEQLIVFIPACYAFAHYTNDTWVLLALGALFIIGRFLYSAEYLKDPKTRVPGMSMTLAANAMLLGGALYGVFRAMF